MKPPHMTLDELIDTIGAIIGKSQRDTDVLIDEQSAHIANVVMRLDSLPAPVDGSDGRDGRDGLDGKDGANGLDGLSLVPCGKWNPSSQYHVGDIVQWEGASWISHGADAGREPGACENWMIIAARGKPGKPGERGLRGVPGEQGDKGDKGEPGRLIKIIEASIVGTDLMLIDEDGDIVRCAFAGIIAAMHDEFDRVIERRLEPMMTAMQKARLL